MASPISRWPQRALMALVRAYRLLLSPWLGSACRFEPTCSVYALQALERHGALAGSTLTVARLARCHPWCAAGFDPVPERAWPLFSRLTSRPSAAHEHRPPALTPLSDKNSS